MEEECILKGDGEMGGAYIMRLPAGDSDIYLRYQLGCRAEFRVWVRVRIR